ncbi:MAG: histidinol-phosphate transaminase [Armatimonadetes bacterium]|nr:histidinol-phosphate transaminase [Armatimonadota bacterium]
MSVSSVDGLVRQTINRIKPYSPGKSSAEVMKELGLERVTKLASNENPLGPSPLAIEAIRQAAAGVFVYPDPQCLELTAALAELLDIEDECIIVGRGSDEVLHMMSLAFINPGENLVFSLPPFAIYPMSARLMDAEEIGVPHADFRHDLPAMADAITERTKIVFISNPYNPTGTIVTAAEADEFMERVPEHVVVAWDEAYYEYACGAPEYPDTLRYVREGRNCVVLRTFSKAYGLAGLRVGYGVARPEIIGALKQVREPFNVNLLAQAAAVASLKDPDQVRRSVENNEAGKQYLYARFDEMGLDYVPTHSNFIFVDVRMDSVECFDRLMRRGVTVRTGEIFGFPTHIRVTIGRPEDNEIFADALAAVLSDK